MFLLKIAAFLLKMAAFLLILSYLLLYLLPSELYHSFVPFSSVYCLCVCSYSSAAGIKHQQREREREKTGKRETRGEEKWERPRRDDDRRGGRFSAWVMMIKWGATADTVNGEWRVERGEWRAARRECRV